MNRLGKQIQLSPWYVPYGGLEDRGLLQCHAPAASLQLQEKRGGRAGRAKYLWGWGLELALMCRIFSDSLP